MIGDPQEENLKVLKGYKGDKIFLKKCIDYAESSFIPISGRQFEILIERLYDLFGKFEFESSSSIVLDKFPAHNVYINRLSEAVSFSFALNHLKEELNSDYLEILKKNDNIFASDIDSTMDELNNKYDEYGDHWHQVGDIFDFIRKQVFYDRLVGKCLFFMQYVLQSFKVELPLNWDDNSDRTSFPYLDNLLKAIAFGWIDSEICSGKWDSKNIEKAKLVELDIPVFMSLLKKYFLDGDSPQYNNLSADSKAMLIYYLREGKNSAQSIRNHHLSQKEISLTTKDKVTELVKNIESAKRMDLGKLK